MPKRIRAVRRAVANSQARRVGLRDYAPAEDGRQPDVHIRTYDPVGDRFSYTTAGARRGCERDIRSIMLH